MAGGCPWVGQGVRAGLGAPRMNHVGCGRLVFVSLACVHVCAWGRARGCKYGCAGADAPTCAESAVSVHACVSAHARAQLAHVHRHTEGLRTEAVAGGPAGEPLPAGGNPRLQPALCCEVSGMPVSSTSIAPRERAEGLCPPLQSARGEKSGGCG